MIDLLDSVVGGLAALARGLLFTLAACVALIGSVFVLYGSLAVVGPVVGETWVQSALAVLVFVLAIGVPAYLLAILKPSAVEDGREDVPSAEGDGATAEAPVTDRSESDLSTPDDDVPTTGDSPTEGDAAGDHPTEGDAAGDSPTEGDAAGDSPTEGDAAGDHPTEGDAAGDHPTGGDAAGGDAAGGDATGGDAADQEVDPDAADPGGAGHGHDAVDDRSAGTDEESPGATGR